MAKDFGLSKVAFYVDVAVANLKVPIKLLMNSRVLSRTRNNPLLTCCYFASFFSLSAWFHGQMEEESGNDYSQEQSRCKRKIVEKREEMFDSIFYTN